jgi:hypothetical protein
MEKPFTNAQKFGVSKAKKDKYEMQIIHGKRMVTLIIEFNLFENNGIPRINNKDAKLPNPISVIERKKSEHRRLTNP